MDSIAIWMKYNNRSIYGCKDAPNSFSDPDNTLLTYNPVTKRLYVHLMEYPHTHTLTLTGYRDKIKYVQFLHDASEIKTKNESGNEVTLQLPERKPNIEIMLN
jgi:alpha-L-fucosidase